MPSAHISTGNPFITFDNKIPSRRCRSRRRQQKTPTLHQNKILQQIFVSKDNTDPMKQVASDPQMDAGILPSDSLIEQDFNEQTPRVHANISRHLAEFQQRPHRWQLTDDGIKGGKRTIPSAIQRHEMCNALHSSLSVNQQIWA